MAVAFVKNLFTGQGKYLDSKLVLSGSASVAAGNTIFVAYGTDNTVGDPITVTDNLGNTYSQVHAAYSGGFIAVRLFRADITNPGTLTSITISQPPSYNKNVGMAVEFSGVGSLRPGAQGQSLTGVGAVKNALPGGGTGIVGSYEMGDLWIGAFIQTSVNTFATETGGVSLPALEPTPEVRTAGGAAGDNFSLGLLYYLSNSSPQTNVALLGRYSGTGDGVAIGAAVQQRVSGPTYNDACSGAIVFTGSRIESWQRAVSYSDAPTGQLVLAGTRTESYQRAFADACSGSIVFTGTLTESYHRVFADSRTGSLVLTGTLVESYELEFHVYSDAASGEIALSGSVSEWHEKLFIDAAAGAIRMYGWAAETLPEGAPYPVGIPGEVAHSALEIVNPTTLRPDTGSGYQVGDVLVCFVVGAGAARLTSSTSGWKVGSPPQTGANYINLLGKVVDSLAVQRPVLTFSVTSESPVMAWIVAFRNLDVAQFETIADVVGEFDDMNTVYRMAGGEAITTIEDNDLVLTLSCRNSSGIEDLKPPDEFGMITWQSIESGPGITAGWAYQVKHDAGYVPKAFFDVTPAEGDVQPYPTTGLLAAFKAAPEVLEVDLVALRLRTDDHALTEATLTDRALVDALLYDR